MRVAGDSDTTILYPLQRSKIQGLEMAVLRDDERVLPIWEHLKCLMSVYYLKVVQKSVSMEETSFTKQ